jgi:hypothetical protein
MRRCGMRVRIFSVFVIALFFGATTCAYARKADLQYWHTETVNWKIASDWKLCVVDEAYFDDDASHYYYQEGDIGVFYSGLAKWLDVSLNFKHVLLLNRNKWKREERPHVNMVLKTSLLGCSISDRNRFEYRFIEDGSDHWRYRNYVTVKFPLKITRYEIQPYVADEFLVNMRIEQLNENRLYQGFVFKITKNCSADIYYMWKRTKSSGKWNSTDVMGTRLTFSF